MDFLLCAAALLILLLAGLGAGSLALPRHARALEVVSLAPLLGAAFVSLTWFGLSLFLSGAGLLATVTAASLALGAGGLSVRRDRIRELRWRRPERWSALLGALLALQAVAVIWLTWHAALGWDGLLNWEIKARIAYLNGGALPADYLRDATRTWSHHDYPLFVPLSEVWVYSWLGRADQRAAKLLFALLYLGGLGLLCACAARLGARGWRVLVPALLLVTVPLMLKGDGSASSGYADFPLAVGYLAAVVCLLDYWRTRAKGALCRAGLVAGLLPWIKLEGIILWLCIMVLAGARAARRGGLRVWAAALLPGLLVWGGWQLFLRSADVVPTRMFLPFAPGTLWANLGRGPLIARAVAEEMLNWRDWGALWPGSLAALLWLAARGRRPPAALPLAVALPILLYAGIYFFSAWPSPKVHIDSSLPRLLLHVSLVALIMVGLTLRDEGLSEPES